MTIKSILKEELENSLHMKKRYEEELSNILKGSIIKRNIKGHGYYYLVYRDSGKFKSVYMGKFLSNKELNKYSQAKDMRAKYRKALSQLKKQIRYLKGALRGKENSKPFPNMSQSLKRGEKPSDRNCLIQEKKSLLSS